MARGRRAVAPDPAPRRPRPHGRRRRGGGANTFADERRVSADHAGGRLAWVSEKGAVVRDVATGELYWQGVMVDITERKRAEEALRASEMRFRTIFDAAAFGVVTVDIRGRIIEANPTLELMAGYEPGELAGVPLAALVDRGEHDELFKLGEVIDGAVDRCAVEHQLRRKDHSL